MTPETGYDPHIEWLLLEWEWWRQLIEEIPPDHWLSPSILPRWSIFDVLAHIVATERFFAGDPVAAGDVDPPAEGFANAIAERNERWLVTLRALHPHELVALFDEVTKIRRRQLLAMTDHELDAVGWTPIGDAPYRRLLQIRVFDCYVHEQDVRTSLSLPGHQLGPVVESALDEVEGALGWIVGKRAGAPQGSSVRIVLTGPLERTWTVVVEDRAHLTNEPLQPTATLELATPEFLALACGRIQSTAARSCTVSGDQGLATQVLANLAFTI